MDFVVNPVTADLSRMTTKMSAATPCAGLLDESLGRSKPNKLTQFVSVALVAASSLLSPHPARRFTKVVNVLLPSVTIDHLQACVSIAYDKWDDVVCSQMAESGLELSTRRASICASLFRDFTERF